MKTYLLDIENMLEHDEVNYIKPMMKTFDCDLCGHHYQNVIEVSLKDGRFLLYENDSGINNRELIYVGKKNWFCTITAEPDMPENKFFTERELDRLHL